MSRLSNCYNVSDFREVARRRLPKFIFEFIDRGAEDEVALAENIEAFRRIKLVTNFCVDLSERDMGTELFGKRLNLPLIIAPTDCKGGRRPPLVPALLLDRRGSHLRDDRPRARPRL
jgi:(S)-mandelate dehydrogenase